MPHDPEECRKCIVFAERAAQSPNKDAFERMAGQIKALLEDITPALNAATVAAKAEEDAKKTVETERALASRAERRAQLYRDVLSDISKAPNTAKAAALKAMAKKGLDA